MFSKTCKYGIKSVLFIARASANGSRVKVGDIVKNAGVPKAFTGKILGELARNAIVESYTGPSGGFEMRADALKKVKVADIVRVIDGDNLYKSCVLGLDKCNAMKPCAMHRKMAGIREQLRKVLESTSVYELTNDKKTEKFLLESL
jgi:Rrf2 family protein